jgi:hypothetical protein
LLKQKYTVTWMRGNLVKHVRCHSVAMSHWRVWPLQSDVDSTDILNTETHIELPRCYTRSPSRLQWDRMFPS